jgi:hypothetical protein
MENKEILEGEEIQYKSGRETLIIKLLLEIKDLLYAISQKQDKR